MFEDTGKHHPAFLKKPALRGDCIKYHDAFRLLGASRIWSQVGPQPIQVGEILALCKDGLGIEDHETRQKYVRLIQRMDAVEMSHHARKLAPKTSK